MSITSEHIWISQNGESVCGKHGGSYLEAAIKHADWKQHPDGSLEIQTPLDNWLGVPAGVEIREYADDPDGYVPECYYCAKGIGA